MEGPNATIRVGIAKDQKVRLANPITLMITPLTVEAALNRNIIRPEETTSLHKASKYYNSACATTTATTAMALLVSWGKLPLAGFDLGSKSLERWGWAKVMEVLL